MLTHHGPTLVDQASLLYAYEPGDRVPTYYEEVDKK
jgi:hypothetical protein